MTGQDGERYAVYPLLHSLLMLPLMAVEHSRRAAALVGPLLVPVFLLLLMSLLRRFGASYAAAAKTALIITLTSVIWPYATSSHDAFPQAVLVLAIVRCLVATNRFPLRMVGLAGVCFGLCLNLKASALVVTPAVAFLLPVVEGVRTRTLSHLAGRWWRAVWTRRTASRVGAFTLGLLPFACLFLWYNDYRFGTLLHLGTGADGTYVFRGSTLEGLAGFMVSPSKSVFLFTPLLLLSVWWFRRLFRFAPVLAVAAGLVCLGFLIAASRFKFWHADWCWGPRLIVPAIPFAMLPLVEAFRTQISRRTQAIFWGLACLGFCVQLVAVSVHPFRYFHDRQIGAWSHLEAGSEARYFSLEYLPIVETAASLPHITRYTWDRIANESQLRQAQIYSLFERSQTDSEAEDTPAGSRLMHEIQMLERPSNTTLHTWWAWDLAVDRTNDWRPWVIPPLLLLTALLGWFWFRRLALLVSTQ